MTMYPTQAAPDEDAPPEDDTSPELLAPPELELALVTPEEDPVALALEAAEAADEAEAEPEPLDTAPLDAALEAGELALVPLASEVAPDPEAEPEVAPDPEPPVEEASEPEVTPELLEADAPDDPEAAAEEEGEPLLPDEEELVEPPSVPQAPSARTQSSAKPLRANMCFSVTGRLPSVEVRELFLLHW
jgi:hypothetical protein